uniref:Spt4/RpoE2 zinc finger domain-containing protein n=1 Tax=Mandrillus leucophaeus TaxID=9568 RepID=A0A2K5YGF6_MANLE
MALETVLRDLHLWACLLCSLVKFEYDGCDYCDMVYDCTSSSFDRIVAMMSPEDINNFKPGVYVVSVTGRLPQRTVQELKRRGVAYKSRDTAMKT